MQRTLLGRVTTSRQTAWTILWGSPILCAATAPSCLLLAVAQHRRAIAKTHRPPTLLAQVAGQAAPPRSGGTSARPRAIADQTTTLLALSFQSALAVPLWLCPATTPATLPRGRVRPPLPSAQASTPQTSQTPVQAPMMGTPARQSACQITKASLCLCVWATTCGRLR